MPQIIAQLLIISLAVSAASMTVTQSVLFRGLRGRVNLWRSTPLSSPRWQLAVADILHCPYCLSHWLAVATLAIYRLSWWLPVEAFAVVALASIFSLAINSFLTEMNHG